MPKASPAVTAATGPETSSILARLYTPLAREMEISSSRCASVTSRMHHTAKHPHKKPSSRPPPTSCTICHTKSPSGPMVPASASCTATANTTTPTPSLNRLSPAKMACTLGGRPKRRNMPTTETGSVGARIAPSTTHHGRETASPTSGNAIHIPAANRATASIVPKSASARMEKRFCHSSR